jgi:hypothetical protein
VSGRLPVARCCWSRTAGWLRRRSPPASLLLDDPDTQLRCRLPVHRLVPLTAWSQWISDYRIVLSVGTFTRLLILLFVPRLWVAGRVLVRTGVPYLNLRPAARRRVGRILALVLWCVIGVAAWEPFLEGRWDQFHIRRHAQQARKHSEKRMEHACVRYCTDSSRGPGTVTLVSWLPGVPSIRGPTTEIPVYTRVSATTRWSPAGEVATSGVFGRKLGTKAASAQYAHA